MRLQSARGILPVFSRMVTYKTNGGRPHEANILFRFGGWKMERKKKGTGREKGRYILSFFSVEAGFLHVGRASDLR